jgi:hypothetical protein
MPRQTQPYISFREYASVPQLHHNLVRAPASREYNRLMSQRA